jgi:hypothetical protein
MIAPSTCQYLLAEAATDRLNMTMGTCFENLQQIRRSGASGLAVLAQLVDATPALNLSDGVSIARSDVVVEFARPMRTFALEASTGSPNGI